MLDEIRRRFQQNGLTLDSLRELGSLSQDMFFREPSLASFVLWSILKTLGDLWDDGQAVPTIEIRPYIEELQPALETWVESQDTFTDYRQMEVVIRAFRKSHSIASGSGS